MYLWDEHNESHVRKHGVKPQEAEEALGDPERLAEHAYRSGVERRYASLGATEAGRLRVVVYSYRKDTTRVVTSRDATDRERRRYRKRGN